MSGGRGKVRKLPEYQRPKRDNARAEWSRDARVPLEATDVLHRRAVVEPTSYNESAGTIEALASTFADVQRAGYIERLDPTGLDTSRLIGAPLLNSHRQNALRDVLGVVRDFRIEPAGLVVVIRLSQAGDVAPDIIRIREGAARPSIGYRVLAWREERGANGERIRVATRWQVFEISGVPSPADAGAKFRSTAMDETENDTIERPEAEEPTVTETRAAVREIARQAGLSTKWADDQIDEERTLTEVRANAFEAMRKRSATTRIRTAAAQADAATRLRAMEDGFVMRHGGPAPEDTARVEAAQPFVNFTLKDHVRTFVRAAGLNPDIMNDDELFRAGFHTRAAMTTTSDLPALLLGFGRRVLLAAYAVAGSEIKGRLARQGSRVDFRPGFSLRVGEIGPLQRVTEAGEIKYVSRSETVESYMLDTFAALYSLSRKAFVNDDLGGLNDWARAAGQAAAQTEADLLWGLISQSGGAGPVMGDGKKLFHADHNNLMPAAALSVEALSDARLMLRNTKGLDGRTPIAATPKFLLVGPELETEAERVLASIYAATTAEVNPFSQRLTLLVDPRITGSQWFIWADPSQLPILEYSYLSSAPGPQISEREGWEVLSREYRVYLDFGAGAIGWRGAVRNPGA